MTEFVKMDSGPATDVTIVAPSDTVDIRPTRGIRATTAGTIKIITSAGNTRICAFAAGETRPICATRIYAADTSCTGIEAMH